MNEGIFTDYVDDARVCVLKAEANNDVVHTIIVTTTAWDKNLDNYTTRIVASEVLLNRPDADAIRRAIVMIDRHGAQRQSEINARAEARP